MVDSIAYEIGRRYRKLNVTRSNNPYKALSDLVPKRWRTRQLLEWVRGWDDQDADLAMEMS